MTSYFANDMRKILKKRITDADGNSVNNFDLAYLESFDDALVTIRDADMAKEMAAYTKNNVLMQASQSMLAQSNQNSSSVLSLLQ